MTDAAIARRPPGRPKNPENVEPELPEVHTVPTGWLGMDDAPTDGKTIVVRSADDDAGQHEEVLSIYRNTRKFDPRLGKFVPSSYWAMANAGGMKLPWDPTGWKPRAGIL